MTAAAQSLYGPATDDRLTPIVVLERVREIGTIALDPCSCPGSIVEAALEYGPVPNAIGPDGLACDWLETCAAGGAGVGLTFVNCPYAADRLPRWIAKIVEEAELGCEIVALLPASPETRWFRSLREVCARAWFVSRRLKFAPPPGSTACASMARGASALFYAGPRPRVAADAFEADDFAWRVR